MKPIVILVVILGIFGCASSKILTYHATRPYPALEANCDVAYDYSTKRASTLAGLDKVGSIVIMQLESKDRKNSSGQPPNPFSGV
jgi:uncharacterized protein YceK